MLNARTLAQAPTAGDTPGPDVAEAPSSPGEPLRPVEAIRTKGGVIVLSNRPAGDEAAPPPVDRAAPAQAPSEAQPAPEPAVATRPPMPIREEPAASDAGGAGLWLLLAALTIAIATVAMLLVRRKRRRVTEHYAALLAGSEPIAPAPEHVGPFARRSGAAIARTPQPRSSAVITPSPAGRTPLPRTSMSDDSSPQSAPPPSGISAPPVSERQWLSQRPPRSYKEPPS
jgi:hypothetical protein